jgi:hypothetical protein
MKIYIFVYTWKMSQLQIEKVKLILDLIQKLLGDFIL